MDLTSEQWAVLAPLINEPRRRSDSPGRPRVARPILNGILWILRTGARWKDLPAEYPPYQTWHRRIQQWNRDGTLLQLLRALATDLEQRGGLDLGETFIDRTFAPGEKKGAPSGTYSSGQRHEDYGYCRRRWSSSRHMHSKHFAPRSDLGGDHLGGTVPATQAPAADWR